MASIEGGSVTVVVGAGDVVGPASSTANSIAIFDDTTGKSLSSNPNLTYVEDPSTCQLSIGLQGTSTKLAAFRLGIGDGAGGFVSVIPHPSSVSATQFVYPIGPSGVLALQPANPVIDTPITGDTLTVSPTHLTHLEYVAPDGTLATLTVTLANGTLPGQFVRVRITQIVTALTITPTNIVTDVALPTAAVVGTTIDFVWDANQSKWLRC